MSSMEIENQVVSIELAKKLKELGVKQDSYFDWGDWGHKNPIEYQIFHGSIRPGEPITRIASAFTVAELLDIAPASTSILKRTDIETKTKPRYYVETFEHYRYDEDCDENPANALAKMLIYLLENNLIEK